MIPLYQFLVVFEFCALNPVQQPADRWIGEDKLKHAFTSVAAVNFAFAGARLAGLDDDAAVISAVTSGAAAGIWKEIHDRRAGRPFSGRDLVWDALGLGLGVVLVSRVR